jgi:hypothetical protein
LKWKAETIEFAGGTQSFPANIFSGSVKQPFDSSPTHREKRPMTKDDDEGEVEHRTEDTGGTEDFFGIGQWNATPGY